MTRLSSVEGYDRRSIDTDALRDLLGDPTTAIVDVRPLAAFNGWRLDGEARGGHILGATAFPASWLLGIDDADLAHVLREKGILGASTVVIYGDAHEARAFASTLNALGHRDVRVYGPGWAAWSAEPSLPVERLANHTALIHTAWLRELIDGGRPEAAPAGDWLLFHVSFGVPEEYLDSHVPGALYLDTDRLEDPADWNRRDPDELEATLSALGITADTTVILYGRDTEGHAQEKWPGRRAGQIAATRAALILSYAGVRDVRVLDGGYDAWARSGGELETVAREPSPVPAFGVRIPQRPELILDIEDAKAVLADRGGAALVSVRTWNEHVGAVSGYDDIGPAGRIVGDVWSDCGSDAYHMQHYRTVDNTMRAYPEIAATWAEAGITPDKHVAFYCGTGWRASETWFYAYLMGWPRISVYDGGWFEWSKDPSENAIEVGVPGSGVAA